MDAIEAKGATSPTGGGPLTGVHPARRRPTVTRPSPRSAAHRCPAAGCAVGMLQVSLGAQSWKAPLILWLASLSGGCGLQSAAVLIPRGCIVRYAPLECARVLRCMLAGASAPMTAPQKHSGGRGEQRIQVACRTPPGVQLADNGLQGPVASARVRPAPLGAARPTHHGCGRCKC